jgi:hypothetical protein
MGYFGLIQYYLLFPCGFPTDSVNSTFEKYFSFFYFFGKNKIDFTLHTSLLQKTEGKDSWNLSP